MTCIVGLVDRASGTVYIGGDSGTFTGWDLRIGTNGKVFRNGPLLIGSAGLVRAKRLLQYVLTVPAHPANETDEAYVCGRLIDAMREAFKAAGYAQKDKDREEHDSACLIGYHGHVYQIDGAYGVTECADGYDAIGVGDSFARGALFATEGAEPESRMLLALQAAERMSGGVRAPFTVLSLPREPEPASNDHFTGALEVLASAYHS